MTALFEQFLGMSFLKVAEPDLYRRNMRGDSQDGLMVAMAVKQAIEQVQIPRSATASAHDKLTGGGVVSASGEGGHFLTTDVHPTYRIDLIETIGQSVETVPGHSQIRSTPAAASVLAKYSAMV